MSEVLALCNLTHPLAWKLLERGKESSFRIATKTMKTNNEPGFSAVTRNSSGISPGDVTANNAPDVILIARPPSGEEEEVLHALGARIRRCRAEDEIGQFSWLYRQLLRHGVPIVDDFQKDLLCWQSLAKAQAGLLKAIPLRQLLLQECWARKHGGSEKALERGMESDPDNTAKPVDFPDSFATGHRDFPRASHGLALRELVSNDGNADSADLAMAALGLAGNKNDITETINARQEDAAEWTGRADFFAAQHRAAAIMNCHPKKKKGELLLSAPHGAEVALDAVERAVRRLPRAVVSRSRVLGRPFLKGEYDCSAQTETKQTIIPVLRQQFAFGATPVQAAGLSLFLPFVIGKDLDRIDRKDTAWSRCQRSVELWPDAPPSSAEADAATRKELSHSLEHYFFHHLHGLFGLANGDMPAATQGPIPGPGHKNHRYRSLVMERTGQEPGRITLDLPWYDGVLECDITAVRAHSLAGRTALVELSLEGLPTDNIAKLADFTRYARHVAEAYTHMGPGQEAGKEEPIKLDVRLPGERAAIRVLGPEEEGKEAPAKRDLCRHIADTLLKDVDAEYLGDDRAFVFHSTVAAGPTPDPGSPAADMLAIHLQRVNTVDGYDTAPFYAPQAARQEFEASTYDRFSSMGSTLMATSHSFGFFALSGSFDDDRAGESFALDYIHRRHMPNHYRRLLVYQLLVRAEAQALHREVVKAADPTAHNRRDFLALREEFTRFAAQAWHQEISPQVQGQELHALLARRLGIAGHMADLQHALVEQERLVAEQRAAREERLKTLVGVSLSAMAIILALLPLFDSSTFAGKLGLSRLAAWALQEPEKWYLLLWNWGVVAGGVGAIACLGWIAVRRLLSSGSGPASR